MDNPEHLTGREILSDGRARTRMVEFLRQNGLAFERDIEYSYVLMDGEQMAACASLAGDVIKCVAVGERYRELGLSATVMTQVCQEAARRGVTHLFVLTKPGNLPLFEGLGFHPISECDLAALLENERDGLGRYLRTLSPLPGTAGAVVLNANPFTLGHRYLVERAAREVDHLHVFVVGEDKSAYPADLREALVRAGTADLKNVAVHPGSRYVISSATFPAYFLGGADQVARAYAQIDLTLFGKSIAPALRVTRRFVGEEPFSPTTHIYNEEMLRLLPREGIRVTVVPRLEQDGAVISASRVRALVREGRLEEARLLVPRTTYEALSKIRGNPS